MIDTTLLLLFDGIAIPDPARRELRARIRRMLERMDAERRRERAEVERLRLRVAELERSEQ